MRWAAPNCLRRRSGGRLSGRTNAPPQQVQSADGRCREHRGTQAQVGQGPAQHRTQDQARADGRPKLPEDLAALLLWRGVRHVGEGARHAARREAVDGPPQEQHRQTAADPEDHVPDRRAQQTEHDHGAPPVGIAEGAHHGGREEREQGERRPQPADHRRLLRDLRHVAHDNEGQHGKDHRQAHRKQERGDDQEQAGQASSRRGVHASERSGGTPQPNCQKATSGPAAQEGGSCPASAARR